MSTGDTSRKTDFDESMIAEAKHEHRSSKARPTDLPPQSPGRSLSLADALGRAMSEAYAAQPYRERHNSGLPPEYRHLGPEPQAIPSPMVRGFMFNLSTTTLPALFDKNGRLRRIPKGASAGEVVTMPTAAVANSRVAKAGAHVMFTADTRRAHAVGKTGDVAMEDIPVEFRLINAAKFGVVDIDSEAEAPTIELPVIGGPMSWKNAETLGVRFNIPRSELRRKNPEDLNAEIATSLALGLARAADERLLAAILAMSPAPFALAAVSSAGLNVGELFALAGTNATGAVHSQDGVLRVAGIDAELTGDMAETIVGAWDRAAIMVNDEVTVTFERLGQAGRLACTAWVTMLPVVPSGATFWTVEPEPEPDPVTQ